MEEWMISGQSLKNAITVNRTKDEFGYHKSLAEDFHGYCQKFKGFPAIPKSIPAKKSLGFEPKRRMIFGCTISRRDE